VDAEVRAGEGHQMHRAVVVLALFAFVAVSSSLAAEDPAPAQAAETETASSPAAPAVTWQEWIAAHAFDPIRRVWVPIPEGVEPGPKTGYIWNLGRWELVKIIQREGYGWGYFDHRGQWHGQVEDRTVYRTVIWTRSQYDDTIPRKSFEQKVLVKSIHLDQAARERLDDLLARNVIQDIMLADASDGGDATTDGSDSRDDALFSYDPDKGVVNISGRAELVAKLATLLTDESTYTAYTTPQPNGNAVEIVSLVDLQWLERAPEPALNIADLNFSGLRRLVGAAGNDYRRLSKALWFNDQYGTVTVIDQPDTIAKIRTYLDPMPYAPKPDRITTNGAQ
jgi:hypothetical protein